MTVRGDITVDWTQRLVVVAAPSTDVAVQDLHDTLVVAETSWDGIDEPAIIDSGGKETLDANTKVGITATLQDAKIQFEDRRTSAEIGTVTTADSGGVYLTDSAAHFQTNKVVNGSTVINFADQSIGTVYEVYSETELKLINQLSGGTDNEFEIGDDYRIYNIDVCRLSGGNVVAVNVLGDYVTPFQPTFGVAFDRTSSASATLQELADIQYASYNGGVTVDLSGIYSGTTYPAGTPREPCNKLSDAMLIAEEKGFTVIYIVGDATINSGDDYTGMSFVGESKNKSILTIESGAIVDSCEFYEATVQGTLDGNAKLKDCRVLNLNYIYGVIESCMLGPGTIVLGGGQNAHFLDCWSGVVAAGTPVIDLGGSGQGLSIRNYNGGIELTNKTGADEVSIDLNSGLIILDNTINVIDKEIVIRGIGTLIDNSTGAPVDSSELSNPTTIAAIIDDTLSTVHGDGIWESSGDADWTPAERKQIRDALGVAGDKVTASGGQLQNIKSVINVVSSSVETVRQVSVGRWRIVNNQLILFKDNGTDVLVKFNLKNSAGQPSTQEVYERVPAQ